MPAPPQTDAHRFWRFLRGLLPPVLIFALLLWALNYALQNQLRGGDQYDEAILGEWIQEARVFRATLPELIRAYLADRPELDETQRGERRAALGAHLAALGELPLTYQAQLPMFPLIYGMELRFKAADEAPLQWDSSLPQDGAARRQLRFALPTPSDDQAELRLEYQLHAYAQRQEDLAARESRLRGWLGYLALAGAGLALLWIILFLRGEAERYAAQRASDLAQQDKLQALVKQQQAEHEKEESRRDLLEQRLATEEAERQALTLKSQLYANIGVMAGSYAHNIKNMMVRPVDLVRRVQERETPGSENAAWLGEVHAALEAITERTQQILRTVQRDPTQAQLEDVDLNELAAEASRAWCDLAEKKWRLKIHLELCSEPLPIQADRSHLQQAIENLIFNARDATYERRAALREEARSRPIAERAAALLAAAEWTGEITVRTLRQGPEAILRLSDNGQGMTEEVRERCLETYFTTKRGSALHEGNSTGLGLGLSFVKTMIDQHRGTLALQSSVGEGTSFELRLPLRAGGAKATG